MKRKMLSTSSSTSRCSSSRKYSAIVSAAWPMRKRLPGSSFICANSITMLGSTPAACMSRHSSSPSRQRSPMPQKILTPSSCPIMLWIISVSSTVLPTPAPPNRPALPPRSSGTSTSIILMPVSKVSERFERAASDGGSRCTERHCTSLPTSPSGAPPSMVLPNTSNMRESVARPTGAISGPPVSCTAMPRARPCVGVSAMPRTCCASRCAMTSMTMLSPAPPRSSERIEGKRWSKRTSTTLPRTATTKPVLRAASVAPGSKGVMCGRVELGAASWHERCARHCPQNARPPRQRLCVSAHGAVLNRPGL